MTDEITQIIEGFDFRFTANQAAGLAMFKRLVQKQAAFHTLQSTAAGDDGALLLLKRIYDLAALKTDTRYENPHDTALATYLLALDTAGSQYVDAAVQVISGVSQLWWAGQVAAEIAAREKSEPLG